MKHTTNILIFILTTLLTPTILAQDVAKNTYGSDADMKVFSTFSKDGTNAMDGNRSSIEINLITPQSGTGVADLTPTFTWSSSGTGTPDNVLYIDTDADPFTGGTLYNVNTAQTLTLGSDLSAGTVYYWGVAVTDGGSDTKQSIVQSFIPLLYYYQGGDIGSGRNINTAADGTRSVYAIDVDGDEDMDVLSASLEDNKIAWYENHTNYRVWKGTISTDWNTSGNWEEDEVPTITNIAVIPGSPTGGVFPVVGSTTHVAACRRLILEAGATLVVDGTLTVYE